MGTKGIGLTFGRPVYEETPVQAVRITIEVFERDRQPQQIIDLQPLRNALEHVRAKRMPAEVQAFAL